MDTLAAIAFGGEPALERVMQERPIRRDENIVSKYMSSSILTGGLYITLVSIIFLTYDPVKELFVRDGVMNHNVFLTAFFNVFIFLIVLIIYCINDIGQQGFRLYFLFILTVL